MPPCVKCGGDNFSIKYWDGKYGMDYYLPITSIFQFNADVKRRKRDNETAHVRECLIYTCNTCGYKFNAPPKDKHVSFSAKEQP